MEKFFNRKIEFNDKTSQMLMDLEEIGCPNISISHFASNSTFPIYADVFDWLMGLGYTIYIAPCSTMASANHNAWWWILSVYDTEDAYDKREYEDTDMFGKWHEAANEAIKKAIEIFKKKNPEFKKLKGKDGECNYR